MNILVDTNLLLRASESKDGANHLAIEAIADLQIRRDLLCVVPQVFYEFWVVSTRPIDKNGRGRTPTETAEELAYIKTRFQLYPDVPEIFPKWEEFVLSYGVSGKPAHDARLIAAMSVHGLTHLLTFNTADFARYNQITVIDPKTFAAPINP